MAVATLRALALLAALGTAAAPAWSAPVDYRLGPMDHLKIKVFDWRQGTGEVHEWTALNDDEVVVGASGKVALALVGEISASGLTTAALADSIASRLQAKVGLSQRPDASVEVIKYRPFYIMGSVEKPGEYDYRPDLTVLQAVSTAGGLDRMTDGNLASFQRDAISNRGELRALVAERDGLLIRQARLDAEVKGADTIAFPDATPAQAATPARQRAIREEQAIFDAHRDSIKSQVQSLAATRDLLRSEVKSLDAKDKSLAHQLDITQKELEQISALVAKGLTVLPRQLEAEQSTASFQTNRLDVQVAGLRAQQDISRAERDELELKNTRRADALKEAGEVRVRLVELGEKIDTTQRLIEQAEVNAPAMMAQTLSMQTEPPLYTLTRRGKDGTAQTVTVGENDEVQPGDTVRVERKRSAASLADIAAFAGGRADDTN